MNNKYIQKELLKYLGFAFLIIWAEQIFILSPDIPIVNQNSLKNVSVLL